MSSAKTRGFLLVTIIIVASFGALSGLFLYGPFKLPFLGGLPTNPGYPGTGSTVAKWNVQGQSAGAGLINSKTLSESGCTDPYNGANFCGLWNVNGGTLNIPFGLVSDSTHQQEGCLPLLGCSTDIWWQYTNPPGLSAACIPGIGSGTCADTNGMDLKAQTTGANGGILLTSNNPTGDPTCNPTGTQQACWAIDYSIVQAQQAINPPCIAGVTACLKWSVTANMTVAAALAAKTQWCTGKCNPSNATQVNYAVGPNINCSTCTSNIAQTSAQTWYLYRLITDLLLSIGLPSSVACGLQNGCDYPIQCVKGATVCPGSGCAIGCPTSGPIQTFAKNTMVSELNKLILTNTQINFGITVNPLVPQCPAPVNPSTCWFGIFGVFIGGQGTQTSGCTGQFCSLVQVAHSQLGLYTDPNLNTVANVTEPANLLIQAAALTNSTLSSLQIKTLPGIVYSSISLNNVGFQYSYAGDSSCGWASPNLCILAPANSIQINVPLIYDLLGSYTNFYYTYPGIPPQGGSSTGTIQGHVYGVGTGLLGGNAPITGACVGIGGQCSGYNGQQTGITDSNGFYSITSIPATQTGITVAASASTFNPQQGSIPKLGVGQVATMDFYLQPLTPPGQYCFLSPIYNPLPPYNQLSGGLCVPTITLYLAAGAIIFLIGTGILAYSPFGGSLLAGLGKGIGSARKRGK